MLTTQLIVAAATLRIAIPAFQLDHAPGALAQRLSMSYSAVLQTSQCATPIAASAIDPATAEALAACGRSEPCLASIGEHLNADFILLGSFSRLDDRYDTELRLLDVTTRQFTKRLHASFEGKLSPRVVAGKLTETARSQAPDICRAMDPGWKNPIASLDFDQGNPSTPQSSDMELPDFTDALQDPPATPIARNDPTPAPPPVVTTAPRRPTVDEKPIDILHPPRAQRPAPVPIAAPVSPLHRLGLVAAIVGGVTLVAATGLGIATRAATSSARSTPPQSGSIAAEVNGINQKAVGSEALFGVGGVLTAGGVGMVVVF